MEVLDLTKVDIQSLLQSVEAEHGSFNIESRPRLLGEFLFPLYVFLGANPSPESRPIVIKIFEQFVSENNRVTILGSIATV